MKIIQFFIQRKISTLCLNVSILLLGLYCFQKTSIDLFPPISLPSLTLVIYAQGLNSKDIERKVTKPLEELLSTVSDLKSIRSESKSNQSIFTLQFKWGTSVDFAALSTREILKKIVLPAEAETPLIFRWDPSQEAILRADVSGPHPLSDLTHLVDQIIKPKLERIPGVASAEITGSIYTEIKIKIDPEVLAAYGLNIFHIAKSIEETNIKVQVGSYFDGRFEMPIKLNSEFRDLSDIQNLPIHIHSKKTILLKDIATIEEGLASPKTMARINGNPSVSLSIKKTHEAATLDVIRHVKEELHTRYSSYPQMGVTYSKDDSGYIQTSRSILLSNFWQASLLTFLVVLLLLKSWSATLIISAAIPISIIGTFAFMKFFGFSQNVFSLAGFTLSAGMVVDSGVVILENIYRHFKEEGKSPLRAAFEGTQEVWLGVITSVITTMAIFLPIVYCIKGIIGILFRDIAFTFCASLGLSLIVGFSLIPCAAALLLKLEESRGTQGHKKDTPLSKRGIPGKLNDKLNHLGISIQDFFLSSLQYFLNHPKHSLIFLGLVYGLSFLSIFALPGLDLIPKGETENFLIQINGPAGATLDELNQKTLAIEKNIHSHKEHSENIKTIACQIYDDKAYVLVVLKKGIRSLKKAEQELKYWRHELHIPEYSIKIIDIPKLDTREGFDTPLAVVIRHDDAKEREKILFQFKEALKKSDDLLYISSSIDKNKPEIHIELDRLRIKELGFSEPDIASEIYGLRHGIKISEFQSHDIRVIDEKQKTATAQDLKTLPFGLKNNSGRSIALENLATIEPQSGDTTIEHTQGMASTVIEGQLPIDRSSLESIYKFIESVIQKFPHFTPHVSIDGTLHVFKDTFSDLFLAFIIAFILVYMILACQFESLIQPITMMLTIPLSTIGILAGVYLFGLNLDVIVMLGIILLVGITVDAGILIIEYTNILRERGMDRNEALMTAIRHRMRPIFITTLTDILGTAPMAFSQGAGAEMYQGFGMVTMFGMTSATFLTLLALPLTYAWIEDVSDHLQFKYLKFKTLFLPKGEITS